MSHDTPSPRTPIGVVAATAAGRRAAEALAAAWPTEVHVYGGASELRTAFEACDAVVAFLAVGAAVRTLAPALGHKSTDAAVVCVDESLRHAVAVLGGHHGANELAERVSTVLGCTPVITTASDASGAQALDSYGADLGFTVENPALLAPVGAALLSGAPVALIGTDNWPLPSLHINGEGDPEATLSVSDAAEVDGLVYRPPSLVVGVGASRGVTADEVLDAVDRALAAGGLSAASVARLASVDAKSDEPGILEAARRRGWQVVFHPAAELAKIEVPNPSAVVLAEVGTPSVAEAAARYDGPNRPLADLLVPKTKSVPAPPPAADCAPASAQAPAPEPAQPVAAPAAGVLPTAGAAPLSAQVSASLSRQPATALAATGDAQAAGRPSVVPAADHAPASPESAATTGAAPAPMATAAIARLAPRGRLALIGLGPGARDLLPPRAVAELRRASVVVGLDQYLDQIRDLLRPGTEVRATGLGSEEARARDAVQTAREGRAVALIGSGDSGLYAMASPALDLFGDLDDVDVVGVPGITASLAAANVLGAPLGHDHAVISLSDLHTPWPAIVRRVTAAAEGDFVTVFYNPRSKGRDWQLGHALDILRQHRPGTTPVGCVRDASRPGQRARISTLSEFDPADVDMYTIVLVGSSHTRVAAGRMVTPRGYTWSGE
ncbi:cobalt-precorrin 5A hydrolase/precorrin-3B C17-methyltransferase [Catenulispora sp. EB89]|uniref:precorrin-3B C(17)-methyltransferase n=1 Tax=Catenulispora sp. EB89 TaxID=3156257 RepID=UPI003512D3B9